ncbi:MAG: MiaB/RimO family radical SAM methylthiotransferase [Oscillospiraceae bacterium]|nr:MiaB/RimO family radical SAM methylthiotransferase [Oscillospiraceae bacterium]
MADAIAGALPAVEIDDPFRRQYFEPLPAGAASGRTRAMLKIQDGCDHFCTYCVIPYTRGRVRSLPLADCAEQAADLKERGFREIVLTGIEIASYGKDLPEKPNLADAVEAVAQAAPGVRLHLGSLEPTVITEEFCARLAALGQLCRHFHLSLQSGCDDTLKRMARRYDTAAFLAACDRLRRYFPGCSLTADLICGFPGETEADFSATLEFLEQCEFFYVHAFPYSVRPGTKAAVMPNQLSHAQKEERVLRAREVIDRLQQRYLQAQVGKTLSVLFENEWEGHAENYCRVRAETSATRGEVLPVRITGVSGDKLLGCINDLQSMTSVL